MHCFAAPRMIDVAGRARYRQSPDHDHAMVASASVESRRVTRQRMTAEDAKLIALSAIARCSPA